MTGPEATARAWIKGIATVWLVGAVLTFLNLLPWSSLSGVAPRDLARVTLLCLTVWPLLVLWMLLFSGGGGD